MATSTQSFAHYMWLETAPVGKLNKSHAVKVKFGEYTYGVIEKTAGDTFKSASDFSLFVIYPDGSKKTLEVTAKEDHFLAYFTPSGKGTYTVAMDNKTMDVLDFTQYDFGIFKPQYHAKTKVVVGRQASELQTTNKEGIEVIDFTQNLLGTTVEVSLKVLFKGEALKENEVTIYISDLWSKKLTTDADGMITLKLPWNTLYTLETTFNETVPGSFNGTDYEFIWHCATYSIALQ